MNTKFSPSSVIWFKRFLPLLFLGLVVGVESGATYFFGHQTLAPLLSILSLSILAFYCTPHLLLISTPLFMLLSYLLIHDHSPYPLVRVATILLGGILAVWISSSRNKLKLQQTEIETILNVMPVPWLLADSSGNLLRFSSTFQNLLGPSCPNLINTSFFSLFSATQNRGEFIRLYLSTVDFSATHDSLNISLSHPPYTHFVATLSPLPSAGTISVLIVLRPLSS